MKVLKLKTILLAALLAVGASAMTAHAATDNDFVKKAAIGGMTEVEAGRTAQQKAASAEVRQFAEHMVTDHTKANDKLKQVAEQQGMAVPASVDAEHRRALDKLAAHAGASFDRAYMDMMLSDHKKTIALFEKEASSGSNPALKAFAAETLPTLKEHLQMAQQTSKGVKVGAR